jgi:hypothetical protein
MSVQFFPFPEYPELHLQTKLPTLLVQLAVAAHGLTVALHSSISVQIVPFPLYPAGQAPHWYVPGLLVQVTNGV